MSVLSLLLLDQKMLKKNNEELLVWSNELRQKIDDLQRLKEKNSTCGNSTRVIMHVVNEILTMFL